MYKTTWTLSKCDTYEGVDMFATPAEQANHKIVHFMVLGFDTDILEIVMEESRDLVDKYVIVENIATHQ